MNTNKGLVLIDLNSHEIINIDDAALKLFGYKKSNELVGKDFHVLIPQNCRNLHKNVMREEIYNKIINVPRKVIIQDTKGNDKNIMMTNFISNKQALVAFEAVDESSPIKTFQRSLTRTMLEE